MILAANLVNLVYEVNYLSKIVASSRDGSDTIDLDEREVRMNCTLAANLTKHIDDKC